MSSWPQRKVHNVPRQMCRDHQATPKLVSGRCGCNFRSVIFWLNIGMDILSTWYKIIPSQMPEDPIADRSTFVTSKRRHFDGITSNKMTLEWRFDVTPKSLLCNVSAGKQQQKLDKQTHEWLCPQHYSDVIMRAVAYQITRISCLLNVCSGSDQRKTSKLLVTGRLRGIHRWPVNSPHKGPVTPRMFPFDDVTIGWLLISLTCDY